MSHDLIKIEGIVLHVTPFREYDKILTLFSPTHGLIKIFSKGGKKKNLIQHPYSTPLARGEYLFSQKNGSLGNLHEGSLLSYPYRLRESLSSLEVSFKLTTAILRSQMEGKAAPKLYHLLNYFLHHLAAAAQPTALLATFLLKILSYEGILEEERRCSHCKIPLKESHRRKGESYCVSHAPPHALFFTPQEELILSYLTFNRSFSSIASFPLDDILLKKIETLFAEAIS